MSCVVRQVPPPPSYLKKKQHVHSNKQHEIRPKWKSLEGTAQTVGCAFHERHGSQSYSNLKKDDDSTHGTEDTRETFLFS